MNNTLEEKTKKKSHKIATFYSFSSFRQNKISVLIDEFKVLANLYDLRGTILIALEGINGTICGSEKGITALHRKLDSLGLENPLEIKFSFASKQPFRHLKVREKNEIVTMGVEGVNPNEFSGQYVEPKDWNAFVNDPSTLVIDTRNQYEISVGTFKGAINPNTETFREFPEWVEKKLPPLIKQNNYKRIAMFCTGGIRCEKATSLLKIKGFNSVFHLHGGILRYLEDIPEAQSLWEGECFVFDYRVALNQHLLPGEHKLCFACGMPLSPEDLEKDHYIHGIQCHHCVNIFSDDDRERFKERQKHIRELQKAMPGNSLWPSA